MKMQRQQINIRLDKYNFFLSFQLWIYSMPQKLMLSRAKETGHEQGQIGIKYITNS